MASEESPLLGDQTQNVDPDVVASHEAVYNRFSGSRKRVIVALSALAGTFPSASLLSWSNTHALTRISLVVFTSGSFLPLIPQIAEDMHSTGQVVRLVNYLGRSTKI